MTSTLKIFLHIPKTAGTSFRTALEDHFGLDAVAFDYGPEAPETSSVVRDLGYRADDRPRLLSELSDGGVRILSGHETHRYLEYSDPENFLVFLRDPIQRLVSEFLHLQRFEGYTKTFSDYCHKTPYIDRQLGYLDGCPLDRVGFLGITERYEESIRLANEQFGWDLRPLVFNTQRTDLASSYVLKGTEAGEILDLNRRDIEFYRSACAEFSRRLESVCAATV